MCPFLLTSLLCPHFPLSPDASWLAVGVSCAAPDAAKYPSNFLLIVEEGRPSYVHTLELPREQTMPASFPPPGLPAPGLATGPLFDFWPCRVRVCVLYSKQMG